MAVPAIEQIEKDLRIALESGGESYAKALADYWGEGVVDVTHEPPLPTDVPMSRDAMLKERRQLDSAFSALMPNFRYAEIYSRIVGEVLYLFADQVGTLADGTGICSPLCSRFTIREGRIHKVVLGIDLVSVEPLRNAFGALANS